jgi:hypothetical protein
MQYAYGKGKIADVNEKIKALLEESRLADLSETPTNNESINKPK